MKTYKIVFFDFDGTLLNHHHQISKKNQAMIKSLKDQGFLIGAATGRSVENIQQILEESKILPYFDVYIGENGYQLYDVHTKESLFSTRLQGKHIKQIVDTFEGDYVNFVFQYNGHHMFLYDNDISQQVMGNININFTRFDLPSYDHLNISKLNLFCNLNNVEYIRQKLHTLPTEEYYYAQTTPTIFEFQTTGTSKWNAIMKYLQIYNIDSQDVICMGDSMNDYEMIQNAGLGVIMNNADSHLKNICNDITNNDNEHDGPYHYFKDQLKII